MVSDGDIDNFTCLLVALGVGVRDECFKTLLPRSNESFLGDENFLPKFNEGGWEESTIRKCLLQTHECSDI